uniref:C-type lectin domain-containing protein n=1 Tax=Plectus sambesii TaxID=2011161 RepID=A0A914V1W4_9BILA
MLLPVGGWGTQFVTIPFMYVTYNYYEVVANTDGTVVTSGGTQYPLNAGQFVQFPSPIGILTSNYPVQVVQLGQHTDDNNLGDPFFLQIPSTDKMSNTSVFFQPTGFIQHGNNPLVFFVRIVTNVNGAGRIALDGKVISALQFKRVASSTFYYYEVITTNNTHLVTATSPSVVYSVVSYTYGSYEACGFVCAFSLPVGNPGVPTNPPPTTTSLPTSPPTGKCPNGWAYFGTTNSCYQIFRQQVIWYVADEYCLSLNNGRHLTSIHSQAENDFIVNLARQVLTITDSPYTWIGLNDIANANQFKWSDRTPYDFQNWGAGEPIQQQGMENCGVLAVAKKCSSAPEIGKWKDVLCGTGNITSFVCKIPSA